MYETPRMKHIVCRAVLTGALVSLWGAPTWADESVRESASEQVLMAHDGSLFLVGRITDETVESVEVVRADGHADTDPITRLEVHGTTILIEKRASIAWARVGVAPARSLVVMRSLPCRAPARLSSDGDWISCTSERGRIEFYDLRTPSPTRAVLPEASRYSLSLELSGADVAVGVEASGLWSIPLRGRTRGQLGTLLFSGVPHGQISVAPSGERAVASFTLAKPGQNALYTFRLDGKGNRRRLMKGAVPVVWSADSRWLLVQRGSRVCVVGAIGGQYKCWRGYTAVDINATGTMLLLARPSDMADADHGDDTADGEYSDRGIVPVRDDEDEQEPTSQMLAGPLRLYVVHTAGAQPEQPQLLLERADGPAAWIDASTW